MWIRLTKIANSRNTANLPTDNMFMISTMVLLGTMYTVYRTLVHVRPACERVAHSLWVNGGKATITTASEYMPVLVSKIAWCVSLLQIARDWAFPRGQGTHEVVKVIHIDDDKNDTQVFDYVMFDGMYTSPEYTIITPINREGEDEKVQEIVDRNLRRMCESRGHMEHTGSAFHAAMVRNTLTKETIPVGHLMNRLAGPSHDFSDNLAVTLRELMHIATDQEKAAFDIDTPGVRMWYFVGTNASVGISAETTTLGELRVRL